MSKSFTFESIAKDIPTDYKDVTKTSAWTDGLTISSEHEPGWSPAYALKAGKKYRITIEEI